MVKAMLGARAREVASAPGLERKAKVGESITAALVQNLVSDSPKVEEEHMRSGMTPATSSCSVLTGQGKYGHLKLCPERIPVT